MVRQEGRGVFGGRFPVQLRAGVLLEPTQATAAEAGVWELRVRPLPARVSVVVVEPDAVHRERLQELSKRGHAGRTIGRVSGTDPLPAFGRRRDLPVWTDRCGVRVFLQGLGDVQRVELGEDPDALGLEDGHPLRRDALGPEPDGVHSEVFQAAPRVEDLLGHAAVDAADRDVRPGLLGAETGRGRRQQCENRHPVQSPGSSSSR